MRESTPTLVVGRAAPSPRREAPGYRDGGPEKGARAPETRSTSRVTGGAGAAASVLSRAELASGPLTGVPSRAAARREAEARALEDYLVACRAHDAQSVRRLLEGEHGGEVSA